MMHDEVIDMKQPKLFFALPFLLGAVVCSMAVLSLSGCSGSADKPTAASGSTYFQGKMNADSEGGVRKRNALSPGSSRVGTGSSQPAPIGQ